jgi:chorismate mutase
MDLQTLRQQINQIDQELIDLIVSRFAVAQEIAKLKTNKDHVYDAAREQELLSLWLESGSELDQNFLRALFHLILNESRNIIIRNAKGSSEK